MRYEITRTKRRHENTVLKSNDSQSLQVMVTVLDSTASGYRLKWKRFADLPEVDPEDLPESYRDAYVRLKALDIQLLTDTNGTLVEIVDRELVIDRWVELMRSTLPGYLAGLDREKRDAFKSVEQDIWRFRDLLAKELIEEIQLFFVPYGLLLNTRTPYTRTIDAPNVIANGTFPAQAVYSIHFDNEYSHRITVDMHVDSTRFRDEVWRSVRSLRKRVKGSAPVRRKDVPYMDLATGTHFILDNEHCWIQQLQYSCTVSGAGYQATDELDLTSAITAPEPNTQLRWDALIEAEPHAAEGYIGRGDLHYRAGRLQEALDDYTMALSLDTTAHLVHYWRSFVWKKLDENEEARADMERAVALAPDSAVYQVGLADLLIEERKYHAAAEMLEGIVAKAPTCSEGWLSLGMVHRQLYRYTEAIAAFDEVVRLRPRDPAALAHRASARTGLRDPVQDSLASMDLQAALAINPKNTAILATIGNDLLASSHFDSAIVYFDRVLAIDPNVAAAMHNRGYAHLMAGRYDAAITDLKEALELDQDFAYAHSNLGWAYHKNGDHSAALRSIDRSIAMDPSNAYAYYNRGLVLHAMGDGAAACESWRTAIERGFRAGFGNAVDLAMDMHCK